MFKWLVALCAAMYLILVTVGSPTTEELAARELATEQQVTKTASIPFAPPVVEVVADIPDLEVSPTLAVETISDEIGSAALVSATTDATAVAVLEPVATQQITAIAPQPTPTSAVIRRITGKRVNLRAGPSTTAKIVGRTVRDDSAEVVEILPSGWAKVYILETGIEAYISAQFLSDAG